MQWEGDEGNELVPAWSCNPVSTRRKARPASHIHLRNWVHTGIVRILYVYSISISQCCNIELHVRRLASFSHIQECCLTQASRQKGESQSQSPESVTWEEVQCRGGNRCWDCDAIQDAAWNHRQVGLYQLQDRGFQGVRFRLQLSEDTLNVSLGQTDLSICSLATEFSWGTWTST